MQLLLCLTKLSGTSVEKSSLFFFFFWKMLTSQKFPTPRPDTKPLSRRARFPFFFLYFSFFADSAPVGLCVTSSQTPTPPTPFSFDSNTAVERVQLVVTPKPQSSTVSETTTGTDSYSQENKSLHEAFTFKPRPWCFVYTCSIICAVHRRSVLNKYHIHSPDP